MNNGKSISLESFSKLFIKRRLFSNYLSRGSAFICITLKTRSQFNREKTCGIELCCVKSFAQWIAVTQSLLDRRCQCVLSAACVATVAVTQSLLILFFFGSSHSVSSKKIKTSHNLEFNLKISNMW